MFQASAASASEAASASAAVTPSGTRLVTRSVDPGKTRPQRGAALRAQCSGVGRSWLAV